MQEHSLSQRAFAETLGTALLVLVGPGSVVATLVLAGKSTPAVTGADLLGISFAFGLIITALVYAIGKVSGCHINPAVTFALAATKRFSWREVPVYWSAQVVGAVLGALVRARARVGDRRRRDALEPAHPGLCAAGTRRVRVGGLRLRLHDDPARRRDADRRGGQPSRRLRAHLPDDRRDALRGSAWPPPQQHR